MLLSVTEPHSVTTAADWERHRQPQEQDRLNQLFQDVDVRSPAQGDMKDALSPPTKSYRDKSVSAPPSIRYSEDPPSSSSNKRGDDVPPSPPDNKGYNKRSTSVEDDDPQLPSTSDGGLSSIISSPAAPRGSRYTPSVENNNDILSLTLSQDAEAHGWVMETLAEHRKTEIV